MYKLHPNFEIILGKKYIYNGHLLRSKENKSREQVFLYIWQLQIPEFADVSSTMCNKGDVGVITPLYSF